ncbi:MAG TPA: polysaccharide deacetylase family protein [Geobacteraceae bacterium]
MERNSVENALTVDVEDWFHVCGLAQEPTISRRDSRVGATMEKLLALLAAHGVEATFFVLGSVAEEFPDLVRRIAAAGHEVASHGYSHRLVSSISAAEFREEIRRTDEILGRLSGTKPIGFRAPQWSLTAETSWAFDILREEGYRYDSSCTPLPLIGNPKAPRIPYRVAPTGGTMWEIPPMVTPTPLCNLPTGGGWGLRFFPRFVIRATIRKLNRGGAPAVLYLHPREFDPTGPRVPLSPLKSFATYGPRRDVSARVDDLLRRFRFRTLRDLVSLW